MAKEKKGKSKVAEKGGKKSFKEALRNFHAQQMQPKKKNASEKDAPANKTDKKKTAPSNNNTANNKAKGQAVKKKKNTAPPATQQNMQKPSKAAPSSSSSSSSSTTASTMIQGANKPLSSMQQQFLKKLEGARFRTINEELYTTTGDNAFAEFQRDPSKFEIYHKGYREQAAQWPSNPLDSIIQWIQNHHKNAVVADMGCGEARLAATVKNTVHSFDLVAANPSVTACNIAHVPLADESVDIVVFCLSLMGTNMTDFLHEAHRILKLNGILKIAEVRSRFGDNKGILAFNKFLQRAGFEVKQHDKLSQNKMFFEVECVKVSNEGVFDDFELKPCQYKKR